MKRFVIVFSSLVIGLLVTAAAFGQSACELDLVGTWKPASVGADSRLYRFGPDAAFTILSTAQAGARAQPREVASAVYALDDRKAPTVISFKASEPGGSLPQGWTSLQITGHDDASLTYLAPGAQPVRWVKLDPNKYFIVLTARSDVFYDRSGPAFPLLLKLSGDERRIDAVGVYSNQGKRAFGPVPQQAYAAFMQEPRDDSGVMLRLEITAAQYARALKVLHTWARRVREDALLYEDGSLDNVLLVKEAVESLNQCAETIKMYKLNYLFKDDWISDKYASNFIPFQYFKELRRLNATQHVRDAEFASLTRRKAGASGRYAVEADSAEEKLK